MRPQDIVAVILALGVITVLISGTSFNLLWGDPADLAELRQSRQDGDIAFWKDTMNVLIGALAGYIAGRGQNSPPPS